MNTRPVCKINYGQSTQYGHILNHNDYPVNWSIPLTRNNYLRFCLDGEMVIVLYGSVAEQFGMLNIASLVV